MTTFCTGLGAFIMLAVGLLGTAALILVGISIAVNWLCRRTKLTADVIRCYANVAAKRDGRAVPFPEFWADASLKVAGEN